MANECNHQCSSCGETCSDRDKKSLLAEMNPESDIKNVIAIVSGKGGVGKTMMTSLLSVAVSRKGMKTGILDADITGASIPKVFGLKEMAVSDGKYLIPAETRTGIKIMSTNLLLEKESAPVLWRGPMIGGMVKQFWTDVKWGELDYLFVDMPPGTGDVPLTVFQSLPVKGIVIVTSPQELVSMIVEKAVNMAEAMNVPILGIVENMSYFVCPDCRKKHPIFGESHVDEIAFRYGIKTVVKLPVDSGLVRLCDAGRAEDMEDCGLDSLIEQF